MVVTCVLPCITLDTIDSGTVPTTLREAFSEAMRERPYLKEIYVEG